MQLRRVSGGLLRLISRDNQRRYWAEHMTLVGSILYSRCADLYCMRSYVEATPKDCCHLVPSSKRKKHPEIRAPRSTVLSKYMVELDLNLGLESRLKGWASISSVYARPLTMPQDRGRPRPQLTRQPRVSINVATHCSCARLSLDQWVAPGYVRLFISADRQP
jgi:hypothetical protein